MEESESVSEWAVRAARRVLGFGSEFRVTDALTPALSHPAGEGIGTPRGGTWPTGPNNSDFVSVFYLATHSDL